MPGSMFQSAKGICLMDRSLNVTYIGGPVERYTSGGAVITSAVLVPDLSQVRFGLDTGISLVYDLVVGEWAIFTYGSEHAIWWSRLYTAWTTQGSCTRNAGPTWTRQATPSLSWCRAPGSSRKRPSRASSASGESSCWASTSANTSCS